MENANSAKKQPIKEQAGSKDVQKISIVNEKFVLKQQSKTYVSNLLNKTPSASQKPVEHDDVQVQSQNENFEKQDNMDDHADLGNQESPEEQAKKPEETLWNENATLKLEIEARDSQILELRNLNLKLLADLTQGTTTLPWWKS